MINVSVPNWRTARCSSRGSPCGSPYRSPGSSPSVYSFAIPKLFLEHFVCRQFADFSAYFRVFHHFRHFKNRLLRIFYMFSNRFRVNVNLPSLRSSGYSSKLELGFRWHLVSKAFRIRKFSIDTGDVRQVPMSIAGCARFE